MSDIIYKLSTLPEVLSSVDNSLPLFLDTESPGLYKEITSIQAYQKGWDKVAIVRNPNPVLLQLILNQNTSVWHNSCYDLTTLQKGIGYSYQPALFHDTFLLSRLAFPTLSSYKLDDCLHHVLGYNPYKERGIDKAEMQKSDWSGELTHEQLTYAALDVYHMPELWDALQATLEGESYKLDLATVKHCLDVQNNGLPLHKSRLLAKLEEVQTAVNTVSLPVNPNSPKQVKEWLGITSSKDSILAELEYEGNGNAAKVRKARSLLKLLGFLKKYDAAGARLYGLLKPSTRSGRLSSEKENIQQIPRVAKCCVGYTKDAGRVLIYADYPALELRTISAILNVKVMIDKFKAGEDLHNYVASLIFGDDFTKEDRNTTKTYNFNLLYGGGVGMIKSILIKYGLFVPEGKIRAHKRRWLSLFPEIDRWQKQGIRDHKAGRVGSTPLGRKYIGNMYTDQMNIENQGAGAEVAKLAFHYLNTWLEEEGLKDRVYIVDFIHDSFITDCSNDPALYEIVAIKQVECMQEAWFQMSQYFLIKDVPMPIQVKVGYNWGDIEDTNTDVLFDYTIKPYKMMGED